MPDYEIGVRPCAFHLPCGRLRRCSIAASISPPGCLGHDADQPELRTFLLVRRRLRRCLLLVGLRAWSSARRLEFWADDVPFIAVAGRRWTGLVAISTKPPCRPRESQRNRLPPRDVLDIHAALRWSSIPMVYRKLTKPTRFAFDYRWLSRCSIGGARHQLAGVSRGRPRLSRRTFSPVAQAGFGAGFRRFVAASDMSRRQGRRREYVYCWTIPISAITATRRMLLIDFLTGVDGAIISVSKSHLRCPPVYPEASERLESRRKFLLPGARPASGGDLGFGLLTYRVVSMGFGVPYTTVSDTEPPKRSGLTSIWTDLELGEIGGRRRIACHLDSSLYLGRELEILSQHG